MKKLLSKSNWIFLALILLMGTTGCSSKVNQPDPEVKTETKTETKNDENKESGEKVVTTMISNSLNPELGDPAGYATDFILYELIYEPLVKYGENGEIEPALAESWEVSDDGTSYTFYLRKDVKFSDGTEFNADNVLKNAARWKSDGFSSPMTGIEKLDDYTVKISFEENCYPCLIELTYPRPRRIAADAAFDEAGEFKFMIGTGEWMVESYKPEEEVILVPNPYYSQEEKPNVDKLVIRKVTDGQSRVMAMQSGEVDISIAALPAESINILEADSNLDVFSADGTMGFFLFFNQDNPIFEDVRVRQAINYAIDNDSIANQLLNGTVIASKGILPDTVPYVTEKNSKGYSYDMEKAKALLAEAGYSDSNQDGILEKDGQNLEIRLTFQSEEYASWKPMCEYIQAELQKVGITIVLDLREKQAFYDSIWDTRDFDMIIFRSYEDSWNPHGFLRSVFYKAEGGSAVCWYDPTLNQLLDDVLKTQDEETRQLTYDDIFQEMETQAMSVPLVSAKREYIYNKRLSNIIAAPTNYESIEWHLIDVAE